MKHDGQAMSLQASAVQDAAAMALSNMCALAFRLWMMVYGQLQQVELLQDATCRLLLQLLDMLAPSSGSAAAGQASAGHRAACLELLNVMVVSGQQRTACLMPCLLPRTPVTAPSRPRAWHTAQPMKWHVVR
jgi:hypothetical protein